MPASGTRLVVKLRTAKDEGPASAAERAAALLERLPAGSRLLRAPSRSGRLVFVLAPGQDAAAVANSIAGDPLVEYAEPDVVDRAS